MRNERKRMKERGIGRKGEREKGRALGSERKRKEEKESEKE